MKTTTHTALKVLRINQGLGLNLAAIALDGKMSQADAFAAAEELVALPRSPVTKRFNGDETLYTLAD